jgi:hypothetical protein
MTHMMPEQQSAFDVHGPVAGTHWVAAHSSSPFAAGTHGAPLQQSFAVVHVCPVCRQAFMPPSATPPKARQRGTPSRSSWQSILSGVCPSQQSARDDDEGHM